MSLYTSSSVTGQISLLTHLSLSLAAKITADTRANTPGLSKNECLPHMHLAKDIFSNTYRQALATRAPNPYLQQAVLAHAQPEIVVSADC